MKYLVALFSVLILLVACTNGAALKKVKLDPIKLPKEFNAYQPSHPINFPHKIHAGNLEIDCKYCHNTEKDAESASIPSVHICMNCHTEKGPAYLLEEY